jgi:hypothetical protein
MGAGCRKEATEALDEANDKLGLSGKVELRLRAAAQILARGAIRAAEADARASAGAKGNVESDFDANQTSDGSGTTTAAQGTG